MAQNQYVEAARALGAGHVRIMTLYILANVMATALSFPGFGVPPPYPSWGAMLSGSGRSLFYGAP